MLRQHPHAGPTQLRSGGGLLRYCCLSQAREPSVQFTRASKNMEVWNASGNGFSFVISHESREGPGFRGRTGFMASWRPIHENSSAIEVGGAPFETFVEAENACKAMASLLTGVRPMGRRMAQLNFEVPAVLRKWPSLRNERRVESSPYLLVEGTLDDCLKDLMAKPISARHLYDIRVAPEIPLLSAVLPEGLLIELARLRNFG
jgi:hypothetical protein